MLGIYEKTLTGQGGWGTGARWEDLGPVVKGLKCLERIFFPGIHGLQGWGVGRVPEK